MPHSFLFQEPWCFTPAQVADLTLWQVENLYLNPARERQKAMESKRGEVDETSVNTDTPESFAAGMDALFPGYPPAKWEADWHSMEAERRIREG